MSNNFTMLSFLYRWLFAAVLVFGTYNPTDFSYLSWAIAPETTFGPIVVLVGLLLLIGWIIFLRATFLSLGWAGIALGAALFACLLWLLVDMGWLTLESTGAITWMVLIVLSLILGTGMSWSHIRRRLSGQVDMDDVED